MNKLTFKESDFTIHSDPAYSRILVAKKAQAISKMADAIEAKLKKGKR